MLFCFSALCDEGEFACADGLTCLPSSQVCDGSYDCEDMLFNPDDFSDEENCEANAGDSDEGEVAPFYITRY